MVHTQVSPDIACRVARKPRKYVDDLMPPQGAGSTVHALEALMRLNVSVALATLDPHAQSRPYLHHSSHNLTSSML
ncbi:hypothetical protein NQ314_015524 [Rhamnusium bicolor]|uniref:Uncharacterized protein n=1 Tax=Rhamnusium bicolor TaxID=1586634 RepID=A0AAV8WXV7_9CUCU|nr:hypothetical protein NQ314_015524 [Rhamnusium bicolor]